MENIKNCTPNGFRVKTSETKYNGQLGRIGPVTQVDTKITRGPVVSIKTLSDPYEIVSNTPKYSLVLYSELLWSNLKKLHLLTALDLKKHLKQWVYEAHLAVGVKFLLKCH